MKGSNPTDFVGAAADNSVISTPNDLPTGLAVVSITASSVFLKWVAPFSGVRPAGYRVVYWNRNSIVGTGISGGSDGNKTTGPLPLLIAASLSSFLDAQQVLLGLFK